MGPKQIAIAGLGVSAVAGGAGFAIQQSYKTSATQDNKDSVENQEEKIGDKLKTAGIELIATNAEDKFWKIAWNENKDDPDVKGSNPIATNANTLKTWCTGAYQKPISNTEDSEKVKKLCVVPPLTIEAKLKKDNKTFTTNWENKHGQVKTTPGLIDKLREVETGLSDVNDTTKGKAALEKWCNNQKPAELEPDTYLEKYKEIVNLCV
ncbi:hypothetical protein A6V39_00380 [Candidatus Mycoplasma haematobovis]|uniref:Uncharacterized protein n=1 Tax=Candidatus Mycoplasma haematobovis TaxID=432608 RepID=A0A1A9QEX9_9MOLU|nr:hypothetical protein [Candidatus Mycoplasma haematobovis]OAL10506.1 hypothetical protein A6V39_00380 [Candidatus Mycoplasma haematobovis]